MDTILEVKNLTKTFKKEQEAYRAVDHVSFSLKAGECVGLIGESGSGKSTVANMVAGLLTPDEGEITFLGENLSSCPAKEQMKKRKAMQMVFQDPMKSFSPQMKLLTGVAEGLRYHTTLSKTEREEKALEMLRQMGLPEEYAGRKCRQLSGGECQIAAIARAMLIHPQLLICDEVTSALDVSIQAQIIQLLYRLKQEQNMSYLFISHDLALVSGFCDRILVMYQGKIVESGVTDKVVHHPEHAYTKHLLSSVFTL